jgi:monovalent cation/hydrogen antiporter
VSASDSASRRCRGDELPAGIVIFLPPLLYSAAFFADLHELRADVRVISLAAIGLVLVTMCAVAVVAHAVVDGLPWAARVCARAVVAPTDPLAATTIARRLAVPRRVVSLLEGESLINDGTALVAYKVAVAAAAFGVSFSLWGAGSDFVLGASGGVAVGSCRRSGACSTTSRSRSRSRCSAGTRATSRPRRWRLRRLAAVTVGIVVGWRAPRISTASMRLQGYAVWETLVFLVNALLFVLRPAAAAHPRRPLWRVAGDAAR